MMMRNRFGDHDALIKQARLFGNYCHANKFEGIGICKGVKVSHFVNLFASNGGSWLWAMVESIIGAVDSDKRSVFDPAVFLLNMQYCLQSDKSEAMFHKCNQQFLANCVKCAKLKYSFVNPKRYASIKFAKELFEKLENTESPYWRRDRDE